MERRKGWLTSGAFARLCGTTKETLRHYKNVGLLRPAHQGENGYFYYDAGQFYDFYAVTIFRQTGTPLEEILRCLEGQDPAGTLALLREQRERLEAERKKLAQMEFVLSGAIHSLELGTAPDLTPRIAWFPKEYLLAIPAEDLEAAMPPGAGEEEMLIAVLERCRALCSQYGLETSHQLGAIHRPEETAGPGTISHLYTRIKEPGGCAYCLEKPAGNYLCLCCRGRWDISQGYAVLSQHIQREGLETAGGVYACDLAGFILNGVEDNAVSMISILIAPGGR